jgi:hypothetical protein
VKRMGGGDKGGAGSQGHYPTTATTGSPPVFDNDPKFTTEIVVERQDDISTIGDPFVYGGMMMTEEQRDERTASVGDNYDYANQLLRASSSSARGQSMMTGGIAPLPASAQQQQQQRSVGPVGASVLSDDDSFEQQFAGDEDDEVDPAAEDRFEVDAPPGKLGMVRPKSSAMLPEKPAQVVLDCTLSPNFSFAGFRSLTPPTEKSRSCTPSRARAFWPTGWRWETTCWRWTARTSQG